MDDIEKELNDLLKSYEYSYDVPENKEMIPKILDLFKNKIIDETCEDHDYITYKGYYYNSIEHNSELMIKYYMEAIEKGNVHAMYNMALYYENRDDNSNMLKYYLMAIEKNDQEAMYGLGHYYYLEKEYENMMKYLKMGIEKGSVNAMNTLGDYYLDIGNLEEMKIYYDMALARNNFDCYHHQAMFYFKKNYEESKKYYLMYLDNETDLVNCQNALEEFIMGVVNNNESGDFLVPYCAKFKVESTVLDEYNIYRNLQNQYMKNKKNFTKEDTCNICYEDKTLILYDCLGHYLCEDCYKKLEKCPYCNIEKHQLMEKYNPYEGYSDYDDDTDDD